jgi:hypothetical protein
MEMSAGVEASRFVRALRPVAIGNFHNAVCERLAAAVTAHASMGSFDYAMLFAKRIALLRSG